MITRSTRRPLRCRRARRHLTRVVMDGVRPSSRSQEHVAQCLACQAEAALLRSMRRGLRDLGGERWMAPPQLPAAVLTEVMGRPVAVRPQARRVAAVAVSAAVVGVVAAGGFRRFRSAA